MKIYEYTSPSGETFNFKLTVSGVIDIEKRTGKSISDLLTEFDKVSISAIFIASALSDGSYNEREKKALKLFEELIEDGKTIVDYQMIVLNIVTEAGFMTAQRLNAYKMLMAKQELLLGKSAETLQK